MSTRDLPAKVAERGDAAGWGAHAYIRNGLILTALLVFGLGTWSATAMLAGAVVAPGQLRVEAQRQVVQHPDGGVVGAILVSEGDVVEAGAVLIRLDGTRLRSELAVLESQLYEIMARRGRLAAEQGGAERVSFDPELLEAAAEDPDVAELIEGQRQLFDARSETLQREIELMQEREEQLREQIRGTEAEVASLERQAELIQEELADQRTLFEKGLAQANRVLALEREAARLEGSRAQLVSQVAQLRGQISELAVERLRLEDDRREEAVAELREIGFRELELKERRLSLLDQLSRLDVRAPRPGIVYDLAVHALQAVVRPADPILYIVPNDTELVIDARVDPTQIDQLHPAQEAVLRFSAFNARTTPTLSGTVVNISADAFRDEVSGAAYYLVEVVPDEGELAKLGGSELIPGMPVEVFIQTDERTALNYLVRPITDYFARALREE
ncbi:MAG TPA: HlyD family type I secretion periplasmic adaptor subunit [Thermohalobaculum sp.]|nr:HlyD family type I secretion periplasmic adaptor subunit [Thermohalobaculum sp.]